MGLQGNGKRDDLQETIHYTYGDANWKDKLTAYNGKPIEYDAIGNPVKYRGWNFTWKAGRLLSGITSDVGFTTAWFEYDHTGMRISKWVNGKSTSYTYNGKTLTHARIEGTRTAQRHFFYDAQGRASIIRYNGIDYAYMHNVQGDVIGIVDMDGKRLFFSRFSVSYSSLLIRTRACRKNFRRLAPVCLYYLVISPFGKNRRTGLRRASSA